MPRGAWFAVFSLALSALIGVGSAAAQAFIAAEGKDANNCIRAAPCRTLQRGINATGAGRELTILTSGEYGPATITKSISILAEGVRASIRSFASSRDAITINAPGGKVALKGLFLTGGNTGQTGITILAASAVHIEDCAIERFAENGIVMSSSAGTELFVSDSVARHNGGYGLYACCAATKLTVDNSRFVGNGTGVFTDAGFGSITRSLASNNGTDGIVLSFNGNLLDVSETTAANNGSRGFVGFGDRIVLHSVVARGNGGAGLWVSLITGGGLAILTNSVFTNNGTGIDNGGTVLTRGNNTVAGNTTDFSGGAATFLPAY